MSLFWLVLLCSGGQKARVALARALYSRASTVLLDDVLSGLDANTSKKVFREALRGPLLSTRTVLMVTHQTELVLPACAWVVLLQDGKIEAQGTVQELRPRGSSKEPTEQSPSFDKERPKIRQEADLVAKENLNEKPAQKLVEAETKAPGAVQADVYRSYLQASSYTAVFFVLVGLLLFKMSDLLEKIWISIWTSSYADPASLTLNSGSQVSFVSSLFRALSVTATHSPWTPSRSSTSSSFFHFPSASENVLPYLEMLLMIEMMGCFIWISLTMLGYLVSLRAGRIFFSQMLLAVTRSTSRWLDRTPTGRLLNRFSKDIQIIDESILPSL